MTKPSITAFFDEATFTVSYILADPATSACAIVDCVLDYDPASGRTSTESADRMIDTIRRQGLELQWILETHVHADHLSAAPYIRSALGGQVAIGSRIDKVQAVFGDLFNAEPGFSRNGSQFDHLFEDNGRFQVGTLSGYAMHTPGHTPACVTYVVGDAAFVGDTMFMPDYGTARADFPGGNARELYQSVRRILSLPGETRLFMCHDYKAPGRDEYQWQTTVSAQRAGNVHVHDGVTEDEFVRQREARDATLDMPRLILPSVQVNMRAGEMPPAEANGTSYLKIPINKV